MTIIEFMDMNSMKYGGVEHFMKKLIELDHCNKYHFVYQSMPRSQAMIEDYRRFGATIHIINTGGVNCFLSIPKVISLFAKLRPDIVHFHFSMGFCFYAPIARLLGVRKIYKTQHNCVLTNDMKQAKSRSDLRFVFRFLTLDGYIYHLFDKVIFCGEYVGKQFVELYGKSSRYETIYFGVEPVQIMKEKDISELKRELSISKDSVVITTIAFAHPVKGIDILLKALHILIKNNANIVAIIVGVNENVAYSQSLHKLEEDLKIKDYIRWVGITDKVNKFLSISDIYCQPSRSEALTLAVCEAKSAKLPVIASNVGGLIELGDVLFNNEDFQDLANKLSEMVDDKQNLDELKQKAYSTYQSKYNIISGVEGYIKIYNHSS